MFACVGVVRTQSGASEASASSHNLKQHEASSCRQLSDTLISSFDIDP